MSLEIQDNTTTNSPKSKTCKFPRLVAEGTTWKSFLLCQPVPKENADDAAGFIMHSWARGAHNLILSAMFNPYLTSLAVIAAAKEPPYGIANWLGLSIQPTSYVSIYGTISSVISAVLFPYVGAISDSTPHRRTYLVAHTLLTILFALLCGAIDINSWQLGGLLAVISFIFYDWSLCFVYAYIPEVGKTDTERNKVSSYAVLGSNGSQVLLMVIFVVVLLVGDKADLKISNGSFESGSSSWKVDTFVNSANGYSYPTLQDCNSTLCTETSSAYDGDKALILNGQGFSSSVGIYQPNVGSVDIQSRTAVLAAYVHSDNLSACELRVFQDNVMSVSSLHDDTSAGYSLFVHSFTTTSTLKNISYEIAGPGGLQTKIDKVEVTTLPTNLPAICTLLMAVFFLIFALMCFTFFGTRAQTRGSQNRTFAQFVKEVNLNLWDSIKLSATTPPIAFYLIGFSFYQSGMQTISALAGTYLTAQLRFSSGMVGILLLMTQLVGIPGAFLFQWLGKKLGLQVVLLISYIIWFLGVLICYFVWVDDRTPIFNVIIMLIIIGMNGGATLALGRSAFAGLVPRGREAEMYGLWGVSAKIISWIGPLMFTVVNESTRSFRNAFLSLASLFVFATIFQICLLRTDYKKNLRDEEIIPVNELDDNAAGDLTSPTGTKAM